MLLISKKLNCKIEIAAHPRSNYDKREFKYSHKITKDKTFDLIQDASVVVSHGSTSLQWAITMRKPIIFITTDELEKSKFASTTNAFADELGKKVININKIPKDINWDEQMYVDEFKYQNYFEKYVKQPGSLEKPLWEIVINHIEKNL